MQYRVTFNYTQGGSTLIEADTAQDAENKIKQKLEEYGLDNLKFESHFRETDIVDVETTDQGKIL